VSGSDTHGNRWWQGAKTGVTSTGAPADVDAVDLAAAGLDDPTLVARAGDGDVHAFEQLVVRHQPAMYRLALRMLTSSGDAEDVVQDVFIAAWRQLPELREDAAFVGWLYRVTTNRCLNVLRARRPTTELDEEIVVSGRAEVQPERAAQISGELAALHAALALLPPTQRACWLLREAHGRSYDEIARIVGTSTTAVRGRIARARSQLAEAMLSWR
jgi:RNA polymerase sigma-70 factor (ECF subfamily)